MMQRLGLVVSPTATRFTTGPVSFHVERQKSFAEEFSIFAKSKWTTSRAARDKKISLETALTFAHLPIACDATTESR